MDEFSEFIGDTNLVGTMPRSTGGSSMWSVSVSTGTIGLTMFPLFGKPGAACDYLTLDEALATGEVEISEPACNKSTSCPVKGACE